MTAEMHPQRSKIVAMIGDTTRVWTDRAICRELDPPLHPATISRFRRKLLGNAMVNLRGNTDKVNVLKDMRDVFNGDATNASIIAAERTRLQQVVRKMAERRETWTAGAENTPVLMKNGQPIKDEAGNVVRVLDHRALAAHDRNGLTAVELEAKLSGLLQSAQGPVNQSLCVYIPNMSSNQAPQVIDIEMIES